MEDALKYVKCTPGTLTIEKFPITKREWDTTPGNPLMRKWEDLGDNALALHGLYRVHPKERPIYNERTQRVKQASTPTWNGDHWELGWEVTQKPQFDIDIYDEKIRRGISSEANRRVDTLMPPRERERRMAGAIRLLNKGKPSWTPQEQAFADESEAYWTAIETIRAREATFLAMDPPPDPATLTDADWT